jgi:hypothetical protein
MWWYALAVLVSGLVLYFRLSPRLRGMKMGDFVRVPIPKQLGPGETLAMGTRMDIASALKKKGVPTPELRALVDAKDDRALVERYWRHHP